MRKKIEWKWESLDAYSYRAKVIGGWILATETLSSKGSAALSTVFIADRDHEWSIAKPLQEQESPPKSSVSEGY